MNSKQLLEAVSPLKDVDGFHPVNVGKVPSGQPALAPCTPAGMIQILKRSGLPIAGQNTVVLGRSDIVGKPVAMLLLHENATVTICHSKTHNLAAHCRGADILVAAIGRPGFVTPDMGSLERPFSMSVSTELTIVKSSTSFSLATFAAKNSSC